jgi:hypothetical protein
MLTKVSQPVTPTDEPELLGGPNDYCACGYQWRAPWIAPRDVDLVDAAYYRHHRPNEVCVLSLGHAGHHMDHARVISPNTFNPTGTHGPRDARSSAAADKTVQQPVEGEKKK